MAFQPDLIVAPADPGEPALVVEVKLAVSDLEAAERRLRQYMLMMRCPVGLLVTPEWLRIYRDQFRGEGEDSIELVGQFDVSVAFESLPGIRDPLVFERTVQRWLESLRSEVDGLPTPLREAVEEHVFPALARGEVRAAGPRRRARTGAA